MARRLSPAIAFTASAAIVGLALAGCGSSSLSSSPGTAGSTPTVSQTKETSLAAKLPAKIKAAGKIVVGTDATYAPNEFLGDDGKTVKGMDVDLFNAVAQKFGVEVDWVPANFDSIILGVDSGKYDVGVSSFTINPDRKKQVTMVSYFNAGTQWAAKTGATIDADNACGKKIAVQTSTVQADEIAARSKKCTDSGKAKITVDQYQAQSDATNAVVTGKDDAMLADSPVCAYAVKQTNGQLALLGDIYDSAPYGYVLPKDQADTTAVAVQGALKALIADGTYKTILAKWGVDAGAITDPTVNPTV